MSEQNFDPSANQTLTGTWTWEGPDGTSKVVVKSPTETTQLTGGSIIFRDPAENEQGKIVITNDENNLAIRSEQEITFLDKTTDTPISLSEIKSNLGSGGSGGTGIYLKDLADVVIDDPKVGDVIKWTSLGWRNGQDATGSGGGGNSCGSQDDFLRRDINEEITGTYTFIGDDAFSKVIVQSPTETTQLTGGSVILTDRTSGETGRLKIENERNDLVLTSNNRLLFKDNSVTLPISLAELKACCDTDSGGGSGGGIFSPIVHDFNIDLNAGVSTDSSAYEWSQDPVTGTDNVNKGLRVVYPSDWATKSSGIGAIQDVMVSEPKQIAMPAGATAALVIFQGAVTHQSAVTAAASHASCHTAHRLKVTDANFVALREGVARNDFFGTTAKNIVVVNNPGTVSTRIQKSDWCKMDVIQFPAGANVTFQSKMDVQKGGRCDIRVRSGRVIIIPFEYKANSVIFQLPGLGLGGDIRGNDAELQTILDNDSPPLTPAEQSVELGRDLRDEMRRAVSALDSRKLHPPEGSDKTQTDYETQIGLLWGLLDSDVLVSYDATVAALQPILDEIRQPAYGVADLFQFEVEAGAAPTARTIF